MAINPRALLVIGFATVVGALFGSVLIGLAIGLGVVLLAELA